MAKVPYGVETLPTISIVWVGCMNITDDRQTDRRQTDGRTMTYSERELEFTFAKNVALCWVTNYSNWSFTFTLCNNTVGNKINQYKTLGVDGVEAPYVIA